MNINNGQYIQARFLVILHCCFLSLLFFSHNETLGRDASTLHSFGPGVERLASSMWPTFTRMLKRCHTVPMALCHWHTRWASRHLFPSKCSLSLNWAIYCVVVIYNLLSPLKAGLACSFFFPQSVQQFTKTIVVFLKWLSQVSWVCIQGWPSHIKTLTV